MIDINELRALTQAVSGWSNCNHAWLDTSEDVAAAVVGHIDESGETYPVATIDCDQYYAAHQSLPLAKFYAAANPATISELLGRLEAAESEALEEARLNGMGSEREAALLAKLEAAKKDRANFLVEMGRLCAQCDALRAALRHEADCVEAAKAKIDALRAEIECLRARIEEMEKQESVATVIKEGDSRYWMSERLWTFPDGKYPLYALPGAQPAPSVPTALLVAVADLCAQMEIVSRVGFVDTPNDKDSCAAFCVAEGTWLEFTRAVESLASAFAATPEAKP